MNRRRAFTLAELLVVIGIIAVLVSLLLPALSRAKESARSVQCQSNVRNIVQAMRLYATENEDALPEAAAQIDRWQPNLPPSKAYKAYYFFANGTNTNNRLDLDYKHGAIMKYLGDPSIRQQIMRCPNIDAEVRANYSYVLNQNLDWDWDGHGVNGKPVRLTQIPHPTERILIFEDDDPDDGHFNLGGGIDMPSIHHFRKAQTGYGNYGFADGHVESLTRAYLLLPVRQTAPVHPDYANLKN